MLSGFSSRSILLLSQLPIKVETSKKLHQESICLYMYPCIFSGRSSKVTLKADPCVDVEFKFLEESVVLDYVSARSSCVRKE